MYTTLSTSFSPQPTAQGREPQQTQKTPEKERTKLRMSCDACATAKVRCSKDHPKCERCNECNFDCVYGPSMKHGKGLQKRRRPESQPATKNFEPTPEPSEQNYHHDLQRSFSDLLQTIGSTANPSSSQPWPPNNAAVMSGTTLPSAAKPPCSSSFDDLLWTSGTAYCHTGSTRPGTPNPASHWSVNSHLDSFDDTLSSMSKTDFSQFVNSEPSNIISSQSSTTSPTVPDTDRPFLQPSKVYKNSETHNCNAMANSTLAILNGLSQPLPDDNGNDAMCPLFSNSSGRVPMQAVQSLADILSCTTDAMGNVHHLLKCQCASDPHMAMLHASIIMRILSWYQLAAGLRTSSFLPLPTPDGPAFMDTFASSASSFSRRSCSTPTTFIAPEPVRLGSYIPDQEDQEPMQRLFLLINLKKLKQLIDAFAQVVEPGDAGPSQLHTTLASWLNLELSQAIKEVGNGAKSAVGK